MDDLLGGADDDEGALAIASAAKEIFALIKMKLHKWLSNCPDVFKHQETQNQTCPRHFIPSRLNRRRLQSTGSPLGYEQGRALL